MFVLVLILCVLVELSFTLGYPPIITLASRHGTISEFDNGNEDWTSYTERLQHYFSANEIEGEAKQKAISLAVADRKPTNLSRICLLQRSHPTNPMQILFN